MEFSKSALILISIPVSLFLLGIILAPFLGLSSDYTYNVKDILNHGISDAVVLFEIGIIFLVGGAITQLSLYLFKSNTRQDAISLISGLIVLAILIIMFLNLILT